MIKQTLYITCLFVFCLACKVEDTQEQAAQASVQSVVFDKSKWNAKEGEDFLYREHMLDEIVYNDTIRSLNKSEILDLLGEPSYSKENETFFYYRITEKRLGWWTLHTKTMVIKFLADSSIAWIKIHE